MKKVSLSKHYHYYDESDPASNIRNNVVWVIGCSALLIGSTILFLNNPDLMKGVMTAGNLGCILSRKKILNLFL